MKHLLLSASLLLFAGNLAAQLYVQPNPSTSTDSYIYANDVVLYVEDDINLVVNTNDPETLASIYLRGDSQLIQGDKAASVNTGSGKLSVWQYGRTNNFGYHNWSTPVGNPQFGAGPNVAGNKNFGITSFYDAQLVSGNPHPTHSVAASNTNNVNGTRDPLVISRRWIYKLGALGTYASWIFVGNTDDLSPGDGYTMKGTVGTDAGNPQLYDFRGRPNDGTISKGAVPDDVFVYLGNPYPSHIDMRDFILENPGIEGTVWYYEKSEAVQSHNLTQIQSGYGSWVPAGLPDEILPQYGGGSSGTWARPTYVMYDGSGTQLPGDMGLGSDLEARFAQIGQGFMVRGNTNGTPVEFNNGMRLYIPAGYYNDFKNTTTNSYNHLAADIIITDPEPDPLNDFFRVESTLRFHIEVNETYTRDMVLMFSDNTTKGEDRGFDGRHPSVISVGDAYWKLEDETDPFVIQTRPFDEFDVIPLGLRVRNGVTNFVVKLAESHNFNNDMYLFDLVNNQYQRLDSDNKATITHNGTAGKVDDRYFIVFRRAIQDDQIPNKIAEMNLDFFQNNRLSQLEVFNPETIDIKSASVYDMSGKLMIHEKNLGMQNTYIFSTANLSSGVYLVKLVTQDDIIVDYKVTVHNKN